MNTGILIAIEGIDGAGKTTQQQMLCHALGATSEPVVCSKEPTNGHWGTIIRRSAQTGRMNLLDELHAFEQDRREHVATLINPALDAGKTVVLDRYFYSNAAYQGSSGGSPTDILRQMKSFAPIPDLVIFIDIPVEVGIHRISQGRMEIPNEFEKPEFLSRCRSVFLSMVESEGNFITINGCHDTDEVHRLIVNAVLNGPMKKKRCAKDYECDEIWCSLRATGNCQYSVIKNELSTSSADR